MHARPAFESFRQSLVKLWVKWRAAPSFLPTSYGAAIDADVLLVRSPATIGDKGEREGGNIR